MAGGYRSVFGLVLGHSCLLSSLLDYFYLGEAYATIMVVTLATVAFWFAFGTINKRKVDNNSIVFWE